MTKTNTNAAVRSHFAAILKNGYLKKEIELLDWDVTHCPKTLEETTIWAKVRIGKATLIYYTSLANLLARGREENYLTDWNELTQEVYTLVSYNLDNDYTINENIFDWWETEEKTELIEAEIRFELLHLDPIRKTSEWKIEEFEKLDWIEKCVVWQAFNPLWFTETNNPDDYPETEWFLQRKQETDLWRVLL